LQALRGRSHTLVTAVLCQQGDQRLWHHVARPKLTMRNFSDAFLVDYLQAEGMALTGSVGAYRLEGLGIHLFDRIDGEHSAILGLPLLALLGFMRQLGLTGC
jgi:septum formation protein